MKEIEMIASHDLKGHVTPYRFRLVAEDESLLVIKIERILYCDPDRKGEVHFRCECIVQERKRIVDILFYKSTMKWYLKI